MNIAKKILSVVLGFAVATIVIYAFEWADRFIFLVPAGINTEDPKAIVEMISRMPLTAFLWLILGYAIGSFIGGLTGSLISGREKAVPSVTIGLLLTVGGAMNLIMIPHPLWFVIASSLTYLPLAWFGYLVARPKKIE